MSKKREEAKRQQKKTQKAGEKNRDIITILYIRGLTEPTQQIMKNITLTQQ